MGCPCSGTPPITGRKIGRATTARAAALTASASATWDVRLPDGSTSSEGPFRSLIKAQGVARRTGGKVV